MTPEPDPETLQIEFEKDAQAAILGHFLQDDKFFSHLLGRIAPEWFADAYNQKILQGWLGFYESFNRPPSLPELENLPEFTKEDAPNRLRLKETITNALSQAKSYGLDALVPRLTNWWHAQIFGKAVRKSTSKYNVRYPQEAYEILADAVTQIKYSSFEESQEESFQNWEIDFKKSQLEYNDALSFGLTIFDQLLAPKAAHGSLLKGDLSLVIAASNVGKTISLITTIAHNVKKGKKCLWVVHEGRISDLKEKMWSSVLNCTATQLYANHMNPEYIGLVRAAAQMMGQYLTFIHLSKPGLTVEEVDSVIRKKQDEAIARTGRGYELIIDDYPAKLTTIKNKSGNMPKRLEDDVIYNQFRTLAENLGVHVLTAIQANREGSRVNNGQKEIRLLTKEDVQESWGAITAATNIWTINRSDVAKAGGYLTYYIDKSRSSDTGQAITCKTDYSRAITHSDELGATWFRNNGDFEQKLLQYMDQGKPTEALVLPQENSIIHAIQEVGVV